MAPSNLHVLSVVRKLNAAHRGSETHMPAHSCSVLPTLRATNSILSLSPRMPSTTENCCSPGHVAGHASRMGSLLPLTPTSTTMSLLLHCSPRLEHVDERSPHTRAVVVGSSVVTIVEGSAVVVPTTNVDVAKAVDVCWHLLHDSGHASATGSNTSFTSNNKMVLLQYSTILSQAGKRSVQPETVAGAPVVVVAARR